VISALELIETVEVLLVVTEPEVVGESVDVLLVVELTLCVVDSVEVLLLVVVDDWLVDKVEVRLAVLEPDCVGVTKGDFETVVLCEGKPDTLCNSLLDADILGLSDDVLLGFDETDGLKVAVFEASGLFDSDALGESLYVLVKSGDKVALPVSVERLLNDSVTDTVLVTPVGNVVGLAVPVLAAVVLTVAVEDSDFFPVKVYMGEVLCVFDCIDVALIDTVRIVVPVTSALRVTDTETVLVFDCAGLRLNVGLDDDVFDCELLPDIVADTVAERDSRDECEYDAVEVIVADNEIAAVLVFGLDGVLDTVNELVPVADNVFAALAVPVNV